VITQQPVDRLVEPGQPATFSVIAVGTPILTYQWQRDDVDIPGATEATYTLPVASLADDGATFRVIVSNPHGDVTSNTVTLNVAQVATLRAGADAYVRSGAYASQNFGGASELVVKQSRSADNTRHSYLRFDLSGLDTIGNATLRLFGRDNVSTEDVGVSLFGAANTTWSESGINWNTKPTSAATALGTATVSGIAGQWYAFDVTQYLQQRKAAGATAVTFVLKPNAITDAQALFTSDESATNRPELLVQEVS
jgi:hypothetical protein